MKRNRSNGMNLAEWSTQLPTPTASDGVRSSSTYKRGNPTLRGATGASGRRRLSPLFVEWMMGLPLGWTDVRVVPQTDGTAHDTLSTTSSPDGLIESTHSEMRSSHKPPRKRGASSGNG